MSGTEEFESVTVYTVPCHKYTVKNIDIRAIKPITISQKNAKEDHVHASVLLRRYNRKYIHEIKAIGLAKMIGDK